MTHQHNAFELLDEDSPSERITKIQLLKTILNHQLNLKILILNMRMIMYYLILT